MNEHGINQVFNGDDVQYRKDMVHVSHMADVHSADMDEWCARQRRLGHMRRVIVAVSLFVGLAFGASHNYSRATQDTNMAVAGDMTEARASNMVEEILNNMG